MIAISLQTCLKSFTEEEEAYYKTANVGAAAGPVRGAVGGAPAPEVMIVVDAPVGRGGRANRRGGRQNAGARGRGR